MTHRDLDRAIAARARAQHGAFNRDQALRAGFSRTSIQRRVCAGAWLRLDAGVDALSGNPATWHRQCMAATRGSNHRSRIAVVRQSDLVETTRIAGIPVVTIGQTLIEVARFLDDSRYDRLVSELVAKDQRVLTALQSDMSTSPGRGGPESPESVLRSTLAAMVRSHPSRCSRRCSGRRCARCPDSKGSSRRHRPPGDRRVGSGLTSSSRRSI